LVEQTTWWKIHIRIVVQKKCDNHYSILIHEQHVLLHIFMSKCLGVYFSPQFCLTKFVPNQICLKNCLCKMAAILNFVSQLMHKITNLWKFELNRSSKLRGNNERRKHPCHAKLCAFRWLISRPQVLNLRSRNQIRGKLILSPKLWHFRGSCFSQCFIPPTSPHYLSPRKVLC
jgi:hypothetical protein